MKRKRTLIASLISCLSMEASALSLSQLIEMGYERNPQIRAYQEQVRALDEASTAMSTLSSPNIGITELDRGMTTRYWTVSQKLEFPTKYSLRDDIESQKRVAKEEELALLKLNVRSKIITLYYALYSVKTIISLTTDDLQNVKEFSRIAETKYAAGKAPMHQTMKAHVLQTQIEADLISLRQEEQALQARLRRVLNQTAPFRVEAFPKSLSIPKVQADVTFEPDSKLVGLKQAEYQTAKLQSRLAGWDYAPDFTLRYQGRLSGEPEDSSSIALEMSVPLWFWGKSAAQKAATHMETAKRYEVEAAVLETNTKAEELLSKVKSQNELLSIMNSALIPQAQTSLSTTLDAYKANKSTLLELLDTERSLLKVKIAYYRMLTQYIENITELETTLGKTVSELAI